MQAATRQEGQPMSKDRSLRQSQLRSCEGCGTATDYAGWDVDFCVSMDDMALTITLNIIQKF